MRSLCRTFLIFVCTIASLNLVKAQTEKVLEPVSSAYVITNVNVIQAPGRRIDQATVIVRKGIITGVGKNLPVPPDAIIIKGDSLFLYAGFIDGLSHVGAERSREEVSREKPKDPGNPSPAQAGITPQRDVRDFLNPAEASVKNLRSVGFTAAHVVPHGVLLPGSGAVVLLGGKTADDMVLTDHSALYAEFSWNRGVYPSTIMGAMAEWRELYRQASLVKSYEALYASNRNALERPSSDRVLQAFYPVIDKKMPVLFKAEKILDIQRVLTLRQDLGFPVIIAEMKEGWDLTDKFKASDVKVFLSLNLPEEKKDKDSLSTDVELKALKARKADFMKKYAAQAAALQKAGVKFGFSALDVKTKDIHDNLRRMIKEGLTEDAALAALTTSPAELLGLSDRLGSVDKGKIANLVLTHKPYFDEKSEVRYVFVEGVPYENEKKKEEKKNSKDGKESDTGAGTIEGTWSMVAQTPQGKTDAKVIFTSDGKNYKGSISGGHITEPVDFSSVTLEAKKLRFVCTITIEGKKYEMVAEGTVEDNSSFKGNFTIAEFGTFPMEGTKDPKPKKQ